MSILLRRGVLVLCVLLTTAIARAGDETEAGTPASPPGTPVNPGEIQARIAGQMVGIGAGLELADGGARIKNIMPNSSAERAALKVGSVITAVDGRPTPGLTLEDVVKLIRGPEGSKVSLSLRLPDGSTQNVELVRAIFAIAAVQSRQLAEGILLIHIPSFNQTTPDDCRAMLRDAASGPSRGLILDLRGCSGGTPQATRAVAELFLPAGSPLWGLRMNGQPIAKVIAGRNPPNMPTQAPLVVLIDKSTLSAGVLLAYALKENGRGKLLGQETAALNRMSRLVTGRGGRGRLVEAGEFLSVDDTPLTGRSVRPDVAVAADASDEAWFARAIKALGQQPSGSEPEGNAPAATPTTTSGGSRTWTDATGKHQTVAEYLGFQDGKVRLKKPDGTVITIPLEKLSAADRKFVEEHGGR